MTQTLETCPGCSAALADDQRYCLECGTRKGGTPLAFSEALAPPPAAPPPAPRPERGPDGISPTLAAAGVGLAVLFLGVGVLVGRAGTHEQPVASAKPTVVRVAGGAPAAGGTSQQASVTSVKSDWPPGQAGWTVQLQELPKSTDAAKVADAKSAAKDRGAADVGVLDTDKFESLPPNNYLIYSGRFDSKAKAASALSKLRKDFPKAKVVHVGTATPVINSAQSKANKQQVDQLQNLTGSDYAKQARKLPDELALPGKPPPKDNKAGGGGSGFETIN